MLKKIRVFFAITLFTILILLFLDFTGTIHQWFGWLAKIQLIPAVLAINVVLLVFVFLITLLFGRIYCSVICPLGILQDAVSYISGKRKKNRFRYSPAKHWIRYTFLALFIIAAISGVSVLVSILDPYASFGRITSNIVSPFYQWGNNLVAYIAERVDSYTFYHRVVWLKSSLILIIAVISFVVPAVLAWRHGRTYCNTICPVGTLLGVVSRFSLFKPVFNTAKCNSCGLCARNCKASCIDSKNKTVDYSRCVSCFNCVGKCKKGAITYSLAKVKKPDTAIQPGTVAVVADTPNVNRRNALSLLAAFFVTNTIKAQQIKVDGGLADIENKKVPDRRVPSVPPGASGAKNMKDLCTACQLCVSVCPNQILVPSSKLDTLMQPHLTYENGYCRPECVKCSQVCPAGAIKPIDIAEKTAISIGAAVYIKENCIVTVNNVQCDNCERHCPTKAITLVKKSPGSDDSLKIPVVDKALCIGCGACENLCPARPFSAIYVEGNVRHHAV